MRTFPRLSFWLSSSRSLGERLIYCEDHSKPCAYPLLSHTGEVENGCPGSVTHCPPVKRVLDQLPPLGRYTSYTPLCKSRCKEWTRTYLNGDCTFSRWSYVCRSECLLFSKTCSTFEAKQAQMTSFCEIFVRSGNLENNHSAKSLWADVTVVP